MTEIIDGRKIRREILAELKNQAESLSFPPIFCDILVGDDLVSKSYVEIKGKAAESIGVKFKNVNLPLNATTEEIVEEIENLNKVPHMCGIIVQIPLPAHIDTKRVLDAIDPDLDVDCLGSRASENFYKNLSDLGCPTALACMEIIDSLKTDLSIKKIVVLGQGQLVGRPVTHLLRSRGLEVETIDSKTQNANELIKNADLIVSGIGKDKFIKGDMIKKGAIVIDAGTSEEAGAIYGDADFDSINGVASYVTPTPGGVGPVTVAMLLRNVIRVANSKK